MAITVPGTQKLVSAKLNHQAPGGTVLVETVDVRRTIPEAKVAAVRAAQASYGPRFSIDFGGAGGTYRDGRGFRQRFAPRVTEAVAGTYLAAIETAITT